MHVCLQLEAMPFDLPQALWHDAVVWEYYLDAEMRMPRLYFRFRSQIAMNVQDKTQRDQPNTHTDTHGNKDELS